MLSSSDPLVRNVAKAELNHGVTFAAKANPTPLLIREFLSGSTRGNFHADRIRYRTYSLWTRTRQACRRLDISFNVPPNSDPTITVEGNQPCIAKNTCTFLHRVNQERHSQRLMDLPDKGKVARALVADIHANGLSWPYTGFNMRFSDWRFIHRARLNLVPTNQNKSVWNPDGSSAC